MLKSVVMVALMRVFRRFLGRPDQEVIAQPVTLPSTPDATEEPWAAVVPAVAGFVQRIEFATVEILKPKRDFMLAARLASVAKLNVRDGKSPRIARRDRDGMPPVPTVRLKAKAQRLPATGNRVLTRKPARPSATIIAFPTRPGSIARSRKAA